MKVWVGGITSSTVPSRGLTEMATLHAPHHLTCLDRPLPSTPAAHYAHRKGIVFTLLRGSALPLTTGVYSSILTTPELGQNLARGPLLHLVTCDLYLGTLSGQWHLIHCPCHFYRLILIWPTFKVMTEALYANRLEGLDMSGDTVSWMDVINVL